MIDGASLLPPDDVKASGGRVLVHCHAGVSRSATVCMAYIMKTLDYDLKSAYDFVKCRRPCVSPNLHFMGQLLEFEKRLGNCTASRNDVDTLTSVQEEDERLHSLSASWVGKDKRRAISTPSALELYSSPFDSTSSIAHKPTLSPCPLNTSSLPSTPLTGLRNHGCLPNKSSLCGPVSHSCSLQSLAALGTCCPVPKSCTPFCKVTESL